MRYYYKDVIFVILQRKYDCFNSWRFHFYVLFNKLDHVSILSDTFELVQGFVRQSVVICSADVNYFLSINRLITMQQADSMYSLGI